MMTAYTIGVILLTLSAYEALKTVTENKLNKKKGRVEDIPDAE